MAAQNNSPAVRPTECTRCLAMSKAGRRALGKLVAENPAFASRFLESLAQAEPKQAAQQQAKPEAVDRKPETAEPAGKATLLDKITGAATPNLSAKVKKVGAGAGGLVLLYQALDNIGDLANGRDAASSAYGVITDNFTNWQAAVEPVKDVLSSPLVSLGAAVGVALLLGRRAWRQLKKSWKAAEESVEKGMALANEKLTGRINAAAEFVKSISKAAFAALTCYHLPSLTEAGRSILEVGPNSNALSQAHQILNHFFSAAPSTLLPVFAYILAVAAKWLAVSSRGFLEPINNRRRERMLEEQRIRAEAAKADAQAVPAKPPQGPAPA